MDFNTFLQFLVPALKAVQKQLDKSSPAYSLTTLVISLANAFSHPAVAAGMRMGGDVPRADIRRVTAALPPLPWTPESIETFAANLPKETSSIA